MKIVSTLIPGCYEIIPDCIADDRGAFIKTFNKKVFSELGLDTVWGEQYYTISRANVIRGLHFQSPPSDQVKLVYCLKGRVMDVALDIRKGSPTYGEHIKVELSAENRNMIYMSSGIAHGFATFNEESIMVYSVSRIYDPSRDTGILWSSANIEWPKNDALLSSRDCNFLPLAEFESPFEYTNHDS